MIEFIISIFGNNSDMVLMFLDAFRAAKLESDQLRGDCDAVVRRHRTGS